MRNELLVLLLCSLCVVPVFSATLTMRVILKNGVTIKVRQGSTGTNYYKVGASKVQIYYDTAAYYNSKVKMTWNGWFADMPLRFHCLLNGALQVYGVGCTRKMADTVHWRMQCSVGNTKNCQCFLRWRLVHKDVQIQSEI